MNNDYYKNDFFKDHDSKDAGENIFNKYELGNSFKRVHPINIEDSDFFVDHNQENQRYYFREQLMRKGRK